MKNSVDPEDRNKYRRAICLLNTGESNDAIDSPCNSEVTINADGSEGEWKSIMPKLNVNDRDKLLRGWVHAGEPLTQAEATLRHTRTDIPLIIHMAPYSTHTCCVPVLSQS